MNTEKLTKILDEMNYIYDIFDDVRNLYHNIENKDDIYNLYNNDDLALLDKISAVCCNTMACGMARQGLECHTMSYQCMEKGLVKMGMDFFCSEIIDFYALLENRMTKENNTLYGAFAKPTNNLYTSYDCKRYIYAVKNKLNEILQNTETI